MKKGNYIKLENKPMWEFSFVWFFYSKVVFFCPQKQRPPKKGPPIGMKHSERENEDSVKLEMDEGEENVQDMHLQMEQEIDKRHQEGIEQLGLGGKDELPAAQLEVPDEVDDAINVESDQQVQVPKAVMEIEDDAAAVPGELSEVNFWGGNLFNYGGKFQPF